MRAKAKKSALRADTTLCPAGEPDREVYIRELSVCCIRSLKEAALAEKGERRLLELGCSCGREWWITSSLDERVLGRFVTHSGPRVGHGPPAA